jgi:alkaline phosphatase
MIGLPSSSHRRAPLPGVDVLIGGGWGEVKKNASTQGRNYAAGNPFLHEDDLKRVDIGNGGDYVVVQRTRGKSGGRTLIEAARRAADGNHRLLGFYGVSGGHLPFRTADGKFNPTYDMKGREQYSQDDIHENPDLADMTEAALLTLAKAEEGFWLMVEAGDVDWANHANNIDNSLGAVYSGEEAFDVVTNWIDENDAWGHTAVIVTADHGHYLVIDDASCLAAAGKKAKN